MFNEFVVQRSSDLAKKINFVNFRKMVVTPWTRQWFNIDGIFCFMTRVSTIKKSTEIMVVVEAPLSVPTFVGAYAFSKS